MSRIMLMVGLVFALVAGASAELTLNIDTGAKTISFSGTDSGIALDIGGIYLLNWYNQGPASSSQSIDIAGTAFEETIESETFNVYIYAGDGTGGLQLYFDNFADITTLTGTGTAISYSGLGADYQRILEGSIGSTIPLGVGWGYSSINVASIPEPATLGLLAAGGIALLRRRNKKLEIKN